MECVCVLEESSDGIGVAWGRKGLEEEMCILKKKKKEFEVMRAVRILNKGWGEKK